ncbi:hypothetical protein ACTWQL_09335 [Pseudalkalibacillus sp. R45]|uniref:hypothetical protein n=1 Tax=Pseudalkalibacillus sp. R45 TaxID=3457433 RepID=UPI003FCDE8FD
MNFSLEAVTTNLVSQIAFLVLFIMTIRSLVAYTRQDWGAFLSGLAMGICCLIVVFFGPQIEAIAKAFGGSIFQ